MEEILQFKRFIMRLEDSFKKLSGFYGKQILKFVIKKDFYKVLQEPHKHFYDVSYLYAGQIISCSLIAILLLFFIIFFGFLSQLKVNKKNIENEREHSHLFFKMVKNVFFTIIFSAFILFYSFLLFASTRNFIEFNKNQIITTEQLKKETNEIKSLLRIFKSYSSFYINDPIGANYNKLKKKFGTNNPKPVYIYIYKTNFDSLFKAQENFKKSIKVIYSKKIYSNSLLKKFLDKNEKILNEFKNIKLFFDETHKRLELERNIIRGKAEYLETFLNFRESNKVLVNDVEKLNKLFKLTTRYKKQSIANYHILKLVFLFIPFLFLITIFIFIWNIYSLHFTNLKIKTFVLRRAFYIFYISIFFSLFLSPFVMAMNQNKKNFKKIITKNDSINDMTQHIISYFKIIDFEDYLDPLSVTKSIKSLNWDKKMKKEHIVNDENFIKFVENQALFINKYKSKHQLIKEFKKSKKCEESNCKHYILKKDFNERLKIYELEKQLDSIISNFKKILDIKSHHLVDISKKNIEKIKSLNYYFNVINRKMYEKIKGMTESTKEKTGANVFKIILSDFEEHLESKYVKYGNSAALSLLLLSISCFIVFSVFNF